MSSWPVKRSLFGVGVSTTTYDELSAAILEAAAARRPALVTAVAVHGLMAGAHDAEFRAILADFDALAPDGQPVRVALNLLAGASLPDRVRAVNLTERVCAGAASNGLPIYLIGSRPEVVTALSRALTERYPALRVVGSEPGHYGVQSQAEREALVARVRASGAALILVGMGCPHQERFAHAHRHDFDAVLMCVGSVFDVLSGTKPGAPPWMQRSGLEWLFRLALEPRRLGARYLVTNSQFAVSLAGALIGRAWRRGAGGS